MFIFSMFVFLIFGFTGCAENNLAAMDAATGASDSGNSESDDGTNDTGEADNSDYEAAWYTVGATLAISGGVATAAGSGVHFVLGDTDLVRLDCDELVLDTLETVEPPTEPYYAQWSLTVPADDGCGGVNATLPSSLSIAMGPLDPEVRAQLGTVGLDQESAHLYGAFFAANGGTIVPFGYAQGAIETDASAAPADGNYVLEPLLLQPVTSSQE